MSDSEKYKSFDDIKCLWMKCGAVDYKLCDKNFECENCDFERQMLSELKIKDNVRDKIENMFGLGQRGISFNHPYYHYYSGLMVRNFIHDNYYIGLEPFIARFIDKYSTIEYCTPDIFVNKGEPILNISNGWGEVNVLSPFNFSYVDKLDIKSIFSHDLHWFAVIETEKHEIMGNSINKKSYFDKLYETKANLLNLIKTTDEVGTTMYDGGAVLDNWSDILGKITYKNLLEKLFSAE